jgi:uncharacterized membrane protein
MSDLEITFDSPWFLLLLGLVPLVWVWSFKGLSGLGSCRRIVALLLRTMVLLLLVLALANLQWLRKSDRMTVAFLLDQSDSIPVEDREAMVDYVVREVQLHRNRARRDKASVIVFGRSANIEVPPLDDDLPLVGRLESAGALVTDATNLEAAMKLAQATFPEDSARRVVIVSDGNENLGDAASVARQLADDGVGIDVVPIWLERDEDVAVERVALPVDIRRGQPFQARVVLHNVSSNPEGAIAGRVRLVRRHGAREETLDEQPVRLPPGKSVFRFADQIDEPDFYEYQAIFVADDARSDQVVQNNRATSFTHVQGRGHVLVIEDWENRVAPGQGECQELVDRLRAMNIEVTVQFTDELFTSLAELQRFDTVVLSNVPRSSGSSADNLQNFSDQQIQMLVQNTLQMGCGLVMLGGPNSFGAGGWANTDLEKAMPVDFSIRNVAVRGLGALAMVMHASEIPEGNFWQKIIAREALKVLGPQDLCAVVHWDMSTGREGWLWGGRTGFLPVGDNRQMMLARLDRMTPGDMPEFEPSLKMALGAFNALRSAAVKHMIVISDGDPSPPRNTTLQQMKKAGIKVTTVAVGAHGPAGSSLLQRVANATQGKYYVVRSPSALPRIYQREARRVARPLIVERDIQPRRTLDHEILQGIDALPPIKGFVMTQVKENPLVETAVISPFPTDPNTSTILATWNYGLGRTVAFTTDAGRRWADQWTGWDQYDKFFGQLVRWSMRPMGETGNFTVAMQREGDAVRVVVDALDKEDEFLNFLQVSGSVVDPQMQAQPVKLRQSAPGRYVGEFQAAAPGSYFVTIVPGAGRSPIRAGISVPYSPEFSDRQTNRQLLHALASTTPHGGRPGQVIEGPLDEAGMDQLLSINTFRRSLAKAVSSEYVWPWLILASACVFLADVFVRRVAVNFAWVPALAVRVRRLLYRETAAATSEAIARLRTRKEEVASQLDRIRAAARFAPDVDHEVDTAVLEIDQAAHSSIRQPESESQLAPDEREEDTYTSRLMKAKRDALQGRDQQLP